ncbi:MAG: hypothetical protein D4R56_03190 [Deltaproteobacteria bacterium]|nr:MAG: hypothetical protein D4R56_03190 [Deltaproteobacteria bacterium]
MDNLFAEKRMILGKFKSATVALRDALDREDMDTINALLTERRQCMDLVNRMDSATGSPGVRQKNEEGPGGEIRKLLEETISLDRDCAERLKSQVRELRGAAAEINHSRLSFNRQVLTKQNAVPRFLDIRS